MEQQFSKLTIDFKQENHGSVFFAHLQNLFKQLIQKQSKSNQSSQSSNSNIINEFTILKIDKVLSDIYKQYKKLQNQFIQVSANFKGFLQQFTTIIDSCKQDKQLLAKVTQDRHNLMQKLKMNVDQQLVLIQENQQLHKQANTMKELNDLLFQKSQNLQQQLKNKQGDQKHMLTFNKIKEQYDRIANSNKEVQNQFSQVNRKLTSFCDMSPSLQVLGLAFDSKPNLKQTIWIQVLNNHKEKLVDVDRTKDDFFKMNFLKQLAKM